MLPVRSGGYGPPLPATLPESVVPMQRECPAFQARVTARALTRCYNACFRSLGITSEQFSLLVGIGGSHEPTLAELAARAGVDATTWGNRGPARVSVDGWTSEHCEVAIPR